MKPRLVVAECAATHENHGNFTALARLPRRAVVGGTGPEGKPFTIRGEYRAIECPHLLEFTWLADREEAGSQSIVRFDRDETCRRLRTQRAATR